MDRLSAQRLRLFLPPAPVGATAPASGLVGLGGQVRALVLGLRSPADWATLAPLWQGVQADLGWPAPAIAVNGRDAFELWFSLADPLPRAQAAQQLLRLQRRYLADVRPDRVHAWPDADATAEPPACPPFAAGPERWAAFVTPDLPAVFGDDPALDFEPGADAQADLLARLRPVTGAQWRGALAALDEPGPPGPDMPAASASDIGPQGDPRSFLLAVMNDAQVPLALRIEAAKALLPGH